jgi:RecF/RecN/SMC N terminal domain.
VQRFADYLQQVAEQSQVLIVTHNPLTTAAARQWLGVSMTGGRLANRALHPTRITNRERSGHLARGYRGRQRTQRALIALDNTLLSQAFEQLL